MSGALARAYEANPELNSQRAGVRASDENVPKAKAGWLPNISAAASTAYAYSVSVNDPLEPGLQKMAATPRDYGVTATQTLFDGQRTTNAVSGAESGALMAREALHDAESTILLVAATAYMDVLRDTATLALRRNNVTVLEVELQDAQSRFDANEVTRTDVEQAKTALATGRADVALARARLDASAAAYRRVIGAEPVRLHPARPIEKLLPPRLEGAIAVALAENPAILGALHQVDVDEAAVRAAEGALAPTVTAAANVQQQYDVDGIPGYNQKVASAGAQIEIPIYQGGAEYASIRGAKERLGQTRLAVETQRRVVRANVAVAWGQLAAARASIAADEANVKAAEFALDGVREEAKDGLRTTQDILNAQQDLLTARVRLVTAQRDRVVASYAVMSAMGRLSARRLGLAVAIYDPAVHYRQTRNRFFGITTPDGR
jgi:outer membrane protein